MKRAKHNGTDRRLNNGRDWLIVRLVQGATKSGVQVDRKKRDAKYACRERIYTNGRGDYV